VVDTSRPCQDVLSSDECLALAQQLSKTIDVSLATAPADERDGFRQGAGILGVPPNDCGPPPHDLDAQKPTKIWVK
jgi:hypothetical protein